MTRPQGGRFESGSLAEVQGTREARFDSAGGRGCARAPEGAPGDARANTCIQPRAERSGRLVRQDGALVRCGKTAAWSCFTCSDPLCDACAHAWGHFPRRAA